MSRTSMRCLDMCVDRTYFTRLRRPKGCKFEGCSEGAAASGGDRSVTFLLSHAQLQVPRPSVSHLPLNQTSTVSSFPECSNTSLPAAYSILLAPILLPLRYAPRSAALLALLTCSSSCVAYFAGRFELVTSLSRKTSNGGESR